MKTLLSTLRAAFAEGFRAARKNLLPGLLLQALMLVFLSLYVAHEGTRAFLERVASTREELGYSFTFVSYVFAAAVLPELLKIAFFQGLRPSTRNLRNFACAAPFWGTFGVIVDFFYRCQSAWFGHTNEIPTILAKTFVDQFLFSPIVGAPLAVLYFGLIAVLLGQRTLRALFRPASFLREVIGIQCAAWLVWIPGVMLVYFMPSLLQVPVAVLITAFWILIFTTVRERQAQLHTSAETQPQTS